MSNKTFAIVILILLLGSGGYLAVKQASKPKEVTIGVKHAIQGRDHITEGQKHASYNSSPASSGPHYSSASAPAPWGAYTQEVPPEYYIHNEEHGGIIVTYNPKLLPASDVSKLQKMFTKPYSDSKFAPNKVLVTPRAENSKPIELASWGYTLGLDKFDADTLKKFYLQHVGQGPEPTAGPSNTPVMQMAK